MESCSLHLRAVSTIPTSLSRSWFAEKSLFYGQALKFPNFKGNPHGRRLKFIAFRAQASGTAKIRATGAMSNEVDSKDENLAFVAGATGRVGSRTVRELLKLGFRVRAGVRSAQKVENLVESVKQMKLDPIDGTTPVEKLEIVECDLEIRDKIEPALGNASIIICCIGASEKEVFDITGPYRIDYQATKNLVDAANSAKVNHFILVSSLGTNKFGFPAAILNLFWGVLIWKRKAEEALIASGIPYTIVRPGGMERPTDAYKETHNIILYPEDTTFGGQVSNLQVAELMACMAKNRSLSYCKVVEVIAETTAPLTPMEELLAKISTQRADIYSPTAPSPTPPSGQKELNVVDRASEPAQASASGLTSSTDKTLSIPGEMPKTRPLSPYIVYEDLKPPTSPSPTPSGPKEAAAIASTPVENGTTLTEGNNVPKTTPTSVVEKDPSQNSTYRSPYYVYDDFKPPSSPSPSAPRTIPVDSSGSQGATLSVNSKAAQPQIPDKSSDGPQDNVLKPQPLSPYTMYEDMKPPTSPTPSPRKS
ncbi:hypothetical protein SLE2022_258880 [Rubroshorea leprosula]